MIKVISFTICPFVQRVTALLEAKHIEYQIEFIELNNKPEWFLQLSPKGQVPVLITENRTALFESEAIVEYLEEAYPTLQPALSFEQKAINRAWSYLASNHYLTQCSTMRSSSKEVLAERQTKLNKAFNTIEQALTQTPFFMGEQLSPVDIAWLPLLHRADIIKRYSGYALLAEFPKLQQWQQQLLATGLAEQSVSADFEQKFVAFYLSEQTYLGQQRTGTACNANSCATTNYC